jgi:AcrR family transcriptional regulator
MGKHRQTRSRKSPDPRPPRDEGAAVSASLALLWEGRERPARGPKPVLSLDAVVGAAIEVADKEGLGAVTMTRLAERLDVTPMAIYRYVPGKDELVDLMNDAALGPPPAPAGSEWRVEMANWARASLARFQARPWLLETAQRRVPIGPNWLGWLDAGLRALEDSGLAPTERINAVMLVDGHVRATAQLSAGPSATQRWAQDFRHVLESTLGDPRYPALTRLAETGGFSRPSEETPFEFGLKRVLDGIDGRMPPKRSRRR